VNEEVQAQLLRLTLIGVRRRQRTLDQQWSTLKLINGQSQRIRAQARVSHTQPQMPSSLISQEDVVKSKLTSLSITATQIAIVFSLASCLPPGHVRSTGDSTAGTTLRYYRMLNAFVQATQRNIVILYLVNCKIPSRNPGI
jgi:hypothetical protein